MSSLDLDQVLYARAGWRKAILVPLWTFQIAVLLCLMGIFAYRLAETFEHYEARKAEGGVPVVEVVWEATNVGFNLVALILNFLEIARKATERLTPFTMVCTHVIKLTLALAVLALDVVAHLERFDGHYPTIGLSLDCGLLAATITTFIYSVITYRRLLKYEDYQLTANAKAQGGGGLELGYDSNVNKSGVITTTTTTELRYSDRDPSSPTQHGQAAGGYVRPYTGASRTVSYSSADAPSTGVSVSVSASGTEVGSVSRTSEGAGTGTGTGTVGVGSEEGAVHSELLPAPLIITKRSSVIEADVGGDRDEGGVVMGRVGRRGREGEEDEEALLSRK